MKYGHFLVAFGSLALAAAPLRAQEQLPADSMEIGRKYTTWFYMAMTDSLIAHMVDKTGISSDQIMQSLDQLTEHAGHEVSVVEEKFITRNGKRQYWRTAQFDQLEEPLLLRWVITPQGEIDGLGLGPLSQAPPIDPPK
ncbi:MAG: hypothetical protein ABI613_08410 [Gemmatimonadota bacterium]